VEAVARHRSVAYVVGPPSSRENAVVIARQMLRFGRALLEAGGLAIKCESSGIGHSKNGWRRLTKSMEGSSDEDSLPTLYSMFVAAPIGVDGELHTCGMHLLGRPDAVATVDDVSEGAYLLESFLLYLLQESEAHPLADTSAEFAAFCALVTGQFSRTIDPDVDRITHGAASAGVEVSCNSKGEINSIFVYLRARGSYSDYRGPLIPDRIRRG
jgi:hypothetical protein